MINLTERSIIKLTDPKIYDRGLKYYNQGRVYDYRENEYIIEASVAGSEEYNVSIDFSDFSLICDCPFAHTDRICKHIVAVLLTKINGESKSKYRRRTTKTTENSVKNNSDDLTELLSSMNKNKLIDRIIHAQRSIPQLKQHFLRPSISLNKKAYSSIKKTIRGMINRLGPDIRYSNYWSKQRETCAEIILLVEPLPHNEATLEFLLEMGYWITEKLNTIDDSHAFLQSLISDLIVMAVVIVDNLGLPAMHNIYRYSAMNSSFDYHINLVFGIMQYSTNSEIMSSLAEKLDKTRYRKDPDFAFSEKLGIRILLEYYSKYDNRMYEELANEFIDVDIITKISYIEYLFKNQRYTEVLQYAWDIRTRYDMVDFVEISLIRLGKNDELIQFYRELLSNSIDHKLLKKLRTLYLKSGKENEWHSFTNQLLSEKMYFTDQIRLLLAIGNHSKTVDILIDQSEKGMYQALNYISDYALKFTVINPLMAVRLYRYLLEKEITKLKRSNHYNRLMAYWQELEELGDIDYLQQTKKQLFVSFPTKKKLNEILSRIPY